MSKKEKEIQHSRTDNSFKFASLKKWIYKYNINEIKKNLQYSRNNEKNKGGCH